jgi:hypothetical protein
VRSPAPISRPSLPRGASEAIAEEALADAVRRRCRGGSWQALAREVAWRAVTGGLRDARAVDALADAAEAMLGVAIDEALWPVEKSALDGWDEFLGEHGGDAADALAAARLDAREEAERRVEAAYARALEALLATSRRAA